MEPVAPDPAILLELAQARMPFGKYEGWRLIRLPEPYLVWFQREGFPRGKLGQQMALALEIKTNGLEPLVDALIED
jgi:uncharacterized protein (DUF3820 family)